MSVQQNIYRQRHNFSKIRSLVPIPNLIDIQKRSYDEFLQMNLLHSERETRGLKAVFESMVPVHNGKNPDGSDSNLEVEFLDYTEGPLATTGHIAQLGPARCAWFLDPDGNILGTHLHQAAAAAPARNRRQDIEDQRPGPVEEVEDIHEGGELGRLALGLHPIAEVGQWPEGHAQRPGDGVQLPPARIPQVHPDVAAPSPGQEGLVQSSEALESRARIDVKEPAFGQGHLRT